MYQTGCKGANDLVASQVIMVHSKTIDISIIIPFFNEKDNLQECFSGLRSACEKLGSTYEMIFVDDGSTDGGVELLREAMPGDPRLKMIRFTRNFGQTAALAAGFKESRGKIYLTLDADNQNDPQDIPKILEKINEGYDVVSGWRVNRRDPFLTRRLPSWIANGIISKMTGVVLKDYGCALKGYKADFIDAINLYGEMHRFIPAYAQWAGARVTEIPVNHFPRKKGKSKYGLLRTFKVILDLITVKFLASFATTPLYLFGGVGIFLNAVAVITGVYVLYQKYALGVFAHRNPLLLLAVFLSVLGVFLVMMGLIAELLMRTYHESQGKNIYLIKEKINF